MHETHNFVFLIQIYIYIYIEIPVIGKSYVFVNINSGFHDITFHFEILEV